MAYLEEINSPEDIKKLNYDELDALCGEIRRFLIDNISKSGGHLASNLGVVELTVAVHKVFDTSRDRLIFDVGHQCYTHKIITGRREEFASLRSYGGLSGFPKPSESIHDAFPAGHASTSVSAALGISRARTIKNESYHVISVLGDGALTGGMVYEALNDAGQSREPMIIILNDNGMSIQKNVGGVGKQLARLRLGHGYSGFKNSFRRATSKLPGGGFIYRVVHAAKNLVKNVLVRGSIFEDMGFTYLGPIDGHDIKSLCSFLRIAKGYNGPVLMHLSTVKGNGYKPAEERPEKYHGISRFDIASGELLAKPDRTFSEVFGDKLVKLAGKDSRICAVTAAMQNGTGLDSFAAGYPARFFDVGIAEEHAVTMAAGMAAQGLLPVFAVYSTFSQRCYDMLIHDVALQNAHVVFAIDRAGIAGEDGETHQGVFDAVFLPQIPGMKVYCPSSFAELENMLEDAVMFESGPVAVRYPRGGEGAYTAVSRGESEVLAKGKDITLVSYGIMINEVLHAREELEKAGISTEVIKLNTLSPLEVKTTAVSVMKTKKVIFAEDCVDEGSAGRRMLAELSGLGIAPAGSRLLNIGNRFLTHGSVAELRALAGIDSAAIYNAALEECGMKNEGKGAGRSAAI
ncbi:MAG: 1-deoxy-D-xylulose-5-phosphate synthase [Oscillospiraceae bacterium]|jgi:1-deoxy-D-xylulose-5-phosphate synthase|nr:1-deoxy-D-xylulose-5-phosphate synthase [Oscillospiraceae bacterium]